MMKRTPLSALATILTTKWSFSAGYSELQEINGIATAIPNRSLTIKYSYLFELLK